MAAKDLCAAYMPLPGPHDPWHTVEEACDQAISAVTSRIVDGTLKLHPMGPGDFKMDWGCSPADAAFCTQLTEDAMGDIARLGIFAPKEGGGFTALVIVKACIHVADHVLSKDVDHGFCTGFLNGRFPGAVAGDIDHYDLNRLMERAFPVGTDIAVLTEVLSSDGFICSPDGAYGSCHGDHGVTAFRERRAAGFAGVSWDIQWSADQSPSGYQLRSIDVKTRMAGL